MLPVLSKQKHFYIIVLWFVFFFLFQNLGGLEGGSHPTEQDVQDNKD